jgi:hypothetical protein
MIALPRSRQLLRISSMHVASLRNCGGPKCANSSVPVTESKWSLRHPFRVTGAAAEVKTHLLTRELLSTMDGCLLIQMPR